MISIIGRYNAPLPSRDVRAGRASRSPKFVPRDAQAFPYARAHSQYAAQAFTVCRKTQRNGLDLDLERTNKRGAHAPHNIRTRKGFVEGPARELAGEYGGDAERDAEGSQRGAEWAVADEYEAWTRRPKSAAPAYEAIPVSGPRSMAQILGLIQYWRRRQQRVSFALSMMDSSERAFFGRQRRTKNHISNTTSDEEPEGAAEPKRAREPPTQEKERKENGDERKAEKKLSEECRLPEHAPEPEKVAQEGGGKILRKDANRERYRAKDAGIREA
ncbi:hypothetical protein K438DRAFT_1776145 [Mycena galopus ATCC 62051]|nr:hypothetical protein K438DRAFT_1776145 [Mycena galopus ATCC 62051]